ncbi:Uu.00g078210.m01.CDS01 [Anthostomella pinea]|uniref:Uu.00g078210.m01.CDS01 n=1 Tax=Anthostomella pinea TaxID=933095 RepID=A0AAI8VKJ5_9PEZI|nr:Uu.00g078210.m01.CDS01 [Anthostomella pinea]
MSSTSRRDRAFAAFYQSSSEQTNRIARCINKLLMGDVVDELIAAHDDLTTALRFLESEVGSSGLPPAIAEASRQLCELSGVWRAAMPGFEIELLLSINGNMEKWEDPFRLVPTFDSGSLPLTAQPPSSAQEERGLQFPPTADYLAVMSPKGPPKEDHQHTTAYPQQQSRTTNNSASSNPNPTHSWETQVGTEEAIEDRHTKNAQRPLTCAATEQLTATPPILSFAEITSQATRLIENASITSSAFHAPQGELDTNLFTTAAAELIANDSIAGPTSHAPHATGELTSNALKQHMEGIQYDGSPTKQGSDQHEQNEQYERHDPNAGDDEDEQGTTRQKGLFYPLGHDGEFDETKPYVRDADIDRSTASMTLSDRRSAESRDHRNYELYNTPVAEVGIQLATRPEPHMDQNSFPMSALPLDRGDPRAAESDMPGRLKRERPSTLGLEEAEAGPSGRR